ncbi:MAG: ADP-ribosylation factor-like protein [Candidatus Hodarchaeota archaeon]
MTNTIQVLLYGLENSGKSTLLRSFQVGHFVSGVPFTAHKFSEIILDDNLKFNIIEVGGRKDVRRFVFQYIEHVEAIIFAIDGSNEKSFKDVETEFKAILTHPHSLGKPLAILFNKKDIAHIHPSIIIEKLGILNRLDRPHQVFSTTAKEALYFGEVLRWINKCLKEDEYIIEDRFSRFFKIYILDMLDNQEEGLPILSILSQLKIISHTGQVDYDRDKIMSILRKLLDDGEIEYVEPSQVYRITGKGLEKLQSSELIKGGRYEEIRAMLDKNLTTSNTLEGKKTRLDKDERDTLDEFDLDELAELYKKTTSHKRKM